jgi:hypothetical protein
MRKLNTVVFLFIIAALSALAFSACEKADPFANLQLDIEKVALDIHENGKFIDDLERLDDATVPYIYDLGNPDKIVVYAGSGATPEEIIVVEYPDPGARAAAYEKLDSHLKEQRKIFDDYNAEYRPLLDDPLIVQAGKYLIYCVSDDYDTSEAVLSRYIVED